MEVKSAANPINSCSQVCMDGPMHTHNNTPCTHDVGVSIVGYPVRRSHQTLASHVLHMQWYKV